jgi:mannitol 2-dehydrogenase
MCAGTREDGSAVEANDPHWEARHAAALAARAEPAAWLAQEDVYGGLGREERFARPFAAWLRLLWDEGARAALRRYLSG